MSYVEILDKILDREPEKSDRLCWRFNNIPMPPSVNALYAGFHRRHKSSDYRLFDREMRIYQMRNSAALRRASDEIKQLLNDSKNKALQIDSEYHFQNRSILTLLNKPKANDTSNREKALHDALAKAIVIDDKWFWHGSYRKVILPNDSLPYVNVTLSLIDYAILDGSESRHNETKENSKA